MYLQLMCFFLNKVDTYSLNIYSFHSLKFSEKSLFLISYNYGATMFSYYEKQQYRFILLFTRSNIKLIRKLKFLKEKVLFANVFCIHSIASRMLFKKPGYMCIGWFRKRVPGKREGSRRLGRGPICSNNAKVTSRIGA